MHTGSSLIAAAALTVLIGGAYVTSLEVASGAQQDAPVTTTTFGPTTTTTTAAPATTSTTFAPTTTTTVIPDPVIVVNDVTSAQQRLTDLGYWLGDIDGKVGPSTKQAILAFQKLNGLTTNSTLDDSTKAALVTAERPVPKTTVGDNVEIDKTHQVILFTHNGETRWVLNTSTGTERKYWNGSSSALADTPVGDYKVYREVNKSDPGPLGALYRPKYFRTDGIAVHGAPYVPAFADSHGCARVTNAAMDFIWSEDLMPIGVEVSVYGTTPSQ